MRSSRECVAALSKKPVNEQYLCKPKAVNAPDATPSQSCRAQETAVDMDNILQRESMDVIGRVAFGRHLGALRSLEDGSRGVNRAMDSIVEGTHSCTPFLGDRA